MKQKLFIITGPTAIGKSDLAVRLAKKNNLDVISADSMQIYKRFNIGTGKISANEMDGVKHYMIDVAEPDEEYSVGKYVSDVGKIIDGTQKGKTPIIVGGTGLYISALLNGNDFGGAEKNNDIREKWTKLIECEGNAFAHEYLKKIDPDSGEKINVNDTKRIIRAIEIFEVTGVPKSKIVGEQETKYEAVTIVLYNDDRAALYDTINKRVDKMIECGLVDEVKSLYEYRNCQSMQAIGYKELIEYLDNKTTLDEAVELIKKRSRNYAKRQITYFKGMDVANKLFVKYDDFGKLSEIFDRF